MRVFVVSERLVADRAEAARRLEGGNRGAMLAVKSLKHQLMLLHVLPYSGVVAEQLVGCCVHALHRLLVVQADGAVSAGKARDVHAQHVHFQSDGLAGEVLVKCGAEGAALLAEGGDLV